MSRRAGIESALRSLALLLPALAPSWRFFPSVTPSPRIEFRHPPAAETQAQGWREFRPAPRHVAFGAMLKRMLWNPERNESLFLVTCAERLLDGEIAFARGEIAGRIARSLPADAQDLQFRLILVSGHGAAMRREVAYVSPVFGAAEGTLA